LPKQLSEEGEGKYEWYKRERYQDSEDMMTKYTTIMSAYGRNCQPPINFKFGGTVANTLDAHRIIQNVQENKGEGAARKVVDSLYQQYFEQEKHPAAPETLTTALTHAGIPEAEAKALVDDESEGLQDVKMLIRDQAQNGIDAVPHVVFEGKRRDITLTGAKEIDQYIKTMEKVVKESS
jgi:predicted DsbA family dithiol-disulfide isomerase